MNIPALINAQKKLLPDLLSVMQKRFHILHTIFLLQPVGRRNLSVSLEMTERILRSEVDFLKDQNLITVASIGMSLTSEGESLLENLAGIIRDLAGTNNLEKELEDKLGIQKVVIISGNSDESPWVKKELGRTCAATITELLEDQNIIAVTGGSTMAAVAEMLNPEPSNKEILFVPARGGIGEVLQNQANTICAKMAEQTNSKHRVMYFPDQVGEEMYKSMLKEPNIKEVLSLIHSASMVLHGIGDARTMAERRKTDPVNMEKIIGNKAVGEAFGYYFNEKGEVTHKVQTIGLQLNDLEHISHVIAVAGGASKGKAIRSYMKQAPKKTILITDEGAAKEILNG